MTLALILAAAVALAGMLCLAAVAANARTAPAPALTGRTVVVHTRRPDDQSVRGVVVGHHADTLILRDAVYLHSKETSVDAAGLIHLPWIGISTVQEIEPVVEAT